MKLQKNLIIFYLYTSSYLEPALSFISKIFSIGMKKSSLK